MPSPRAIPASAGMILPLAVKTVIASYLFSFGATVAPMSVDQTRIALELLRPIAKPIPFAGPILEAVIDLVIQGCMHAKVSIRQHQGMYI
jgi:hypothetical protein